ncbi:MAG TPA: diguanylate cyclase [Solirubrobacterales bacterium]|jgi:diguanylate cyclase (GGDEF)-like protein/PAS domain S-box-containing protein
MPVPRDIIKRPRLAVAVAAGLFAAVFLARVTFGTQADGITLLYVIPVVVVAVACGTRGGLLAAGVAFAVASASTAIADAPSSALGYFNRALVFLFVGGLTGHFATSLRVLERQSARHFDLSQDMFCTADFNGYFTRINPAFERVLGYGEDDLLGRPFLEFVHPEDRERTEEEAAALAEGAETIHFQNRYIDKRGEIHWLEWMSQPAADEETIYAVARDITERKALERELERLSQHDGLTGLFNRRRFEEELRRQLSYTRRYGQGGALLLIDVDHFKEINDTLGHAAGDKALCWVASTLRDNLRSTDVVARGADPIVARLGGDEFVVLLPEIDEDEARAVAERLVTLLGDSTLTLEGGEVRLRISVGVATFDGYGRPGEQELLAAADKAMYEAKAAGRLL